LFQINSDFFVRIYFVIFFVRIYFVIFLSEFIQFNYGKYSDEEMYKYAVSQRADYIHDNEISTISRVSNFVGYHRHDKYVEIIITNTLS
jgi:hypothetical protein